MFHRLGQLVSRGWPALLLAWCAFLVFLRVAAPSLSSVAQPGEFRFLPDDVPSRQGEQVFQRAFPHDLLGSSVVIVANRQDHSRLSADDLSFIDDVLKPRLQELMAHPEEDTSEPAPPPQNADRPGGRKPRETFASIVGVRTPGSREIGKLLISDDQQAALAMVDLKTEFMTHEIGKPVAAIEGVIRELRSENLVPPDLQLTLSGSAVLGRDIHEAQVQSARDVENWTLILVVALLLLVYRAPFPVLIPLATLFIAIRVSMRLLAWAASQGWIELFEGIEVYTTVVAYGAGVDFSMFLTSRFHEEIPRSKSVEEAMTRTIVSVGPAVTAAAGTVILGIGMMIFAQFGKFHEAGISISFTLLIILCAALTFAVSLLRMMGRWAFWPEPPALAGQPDPPLGLLGRWVHRLTIHAALQRFWEWLAQQITSHPRRAWLLTVFGMLPFVVVGLWTSDTVSYGLINQLRSSASSVVGTQAITRHFSAGLIGPVTVVVEQPDVDFETSSGQALIKELVDTLAVRKQQLHISDIRSVSNPLGLYHVWEEAPQGSRVLGRILRKNAQRAGARGRYIGEKDGTGAQTCRIDIVLDGDPFARESISKLDGIEQAVNQALPAGLNHARIYLIGPTASIRDLQTVANGDRLRIYLLVTIAVFVVLLILIRSLPDSVYLMASVIFSFLCALGTAYTVFWLLNPQDFDGLDWTVPVFLFTILVAVGQDYNIFLITRVHEERAHHGPVGSVRFGIIQTAAIITSCGLIMAGTFSSLTVGGQLARMTQLGFALAFGVLLDTFIVRPILVPSYLAWRAHRAERRMRAASEPVEP